MLNLAWLFYKSRLIDLFLLLFILTKILKMILKNTIIYFQNFRVITLSSRILRIWELNESRSHRFCASLITFRVIPRKSWLLFRFSFHSSFYSLHIFSSVQFYFPKNNSNLYRIALSNTCIHRRATPTTWMHRQGEEKNTFFWRLVQAR